MGVTDRLKKLRTSYANVPDNDPKASQARPFYQDVPLESKEQSMVREMRDNRERQEELRRRGTVHEATPEEQGYKKRGGR
jgi:hypothetical protein